mmetsp:Transcript_12274/g.21903  ORF Transcript_12274/g.21903 Transcript_12274/m.21903 type:complete len:343 (+) Transcript_12274:391-1419(+)|eukprot:CAMPEP_0184528614 /NCGR_PEP_ID=MMETSP0198_2-20121128/11887_1 /TAXON_ID=1112570 /ORGANISM="Thraustochytrium sp., Strain LLF1b" /LENGTH=342 /DNA_ID=CAMNT_0026920475 /DNA_START=328 /DNA_END=1356 /DNA_ORIENTATION=+
MKKAAKSIKTLFQRSTRKLSIEPGKEQAKLEEFEARFKFGKVLGRGNFSIVRQAEDVVTGQEVAVKCMSKRALEDEDKEAIKREVEILQGLEHPNIIKLYGMYEDKDTFYVVTELLQGGELFDRIVDKEFYSEQMAAKVVKTIAQALQFCNEVGVVHRDLKPENVLLVNKDDDTSLKLADFGFAKEVNPEGDAELKTTCGTPGYVAPEIISGKRYGKEVDMWSLGVILYILLCGYPPFYDDNQAQLFKKIKKGSYTFDQDFWGEVSDSAKDLVQSLLVVDPKSRFTVEEVLNHPWVLQGGGEKDITPALHNLRKYQARRRIKRAGNTVRAAVKFKRMAGTTS